jgi:hypothetical protein
VDSEETRLVSQGVRELMNATGRPECWIEGALESMGEGISSDTAIASGGEDPIAPWVTAQTEG